MKTHQDRSWGSHSSPFLTHLGSQGPKRPSIGLTLPFGMKLTFGRPLSASNDPYSLYVVANEFISWRPIRTDYQGHVSSAFYLIWGTRALKRHSFCLKLTLRSPLPASVDLGGLFAVEIELISWKYIRPDQCTIAGPNRELYPQIQKLSQMFFKLSGITPGY